jgi:hypothetical protein
MRKAFKQAVPLRTVVVYCHDPRAVNIPHAVAKAIPGEVYPGEIVQDEGGKKIASTTTIFSVVVAGGRAVDALRSITVAQHLFGIENIVVVHHTYCEPRLSLPRASSKPSIPSRVSTYPPSTTAATLRLLIMNHRSNATHVSSGNRREHRRM